MGSRCRSSAIKAAGGDEMARAEDRSFTLEDVRRSYTEDKAWAEMSGDLPAYLLYRPLSFYLTLPLLRRGVTATSVTLVSGLLALCMVPLAWWGGTHAYVLVAGAALLFHVLDCVDGNLARTLGASSLLGAVIDGAVDLTFWASLFVSLGVLASRETHALSPFALYLALSALSVVFMQRIVRDLVAVHGQVRAEQSERRPERLSLLDRVQIAFGGLEHVYAFGILVAGSFGNLTGLLVSVVAYVLVVAAIAVVLTLRKAAALDRARRQTR